ncbi:MAG TPA: hypothetical protein VEA69_04080 [Tepidisphaeraceae bacterium]|nr:hypothetical protein [Tepidisphaeraceae bacterium]
MLRRLFPGYDSFTLFARDAGAGAPRAAPGFELRDVVPRSADASALEAFCAGHGFAPRWATDMLDGSRAVIALGATDGAIAAMGWMTTGPFYVAEMNLTIEPPAGGAYLFGDFVTPASRGKGLQAALVAWRVARAVGGPMVTLIHPSNVASVKSYGQNEFRAAARLETRKWGPFFATRRAVPATGARVGVDLKGRTLRVRAQK